MSTKKRTGLAVTPEGVFGRVKRKTAASGRATWTPARRADPAAVPEVIRSRGGDRPRPDEVDEEFEEWCVEFLRERFGDDLADRYLSRCCGEITRGEFSAAFRAEWDARFPGM
jgi:hypothetical protein